MKILPRKKTGLDAFHFWAESVSLSRVTSSYNEAIGRRKALAIYLERRTKGSA
ncbi:MAG TPA: hypothetical protein H9825_13600 [Candidatus Sphingobacterium stercorigallinarum]|nr:hypothetical protein [Candidatus Sphingobacterium stercorigallinarum]